MKSALFLPLFSMILLPLVCLAHVGSPDVFYEGNAGPYRLFVTVRTPAMIPGIAEIEVRSLSGDVHGIEIAPSRIVGQGSTNAPPSDHMERSSADPSYFTGRIWLMESGSYQVRMEVFGGGGKAEMAVPIAAAARSTLPMQKTLGVVLLGLMTVLGVALVSILGAVVRESQVEPGVTPSRAEVRRGRIAMGVTAAVILGVLYLGNWWWNAAAAARKDLMLYKQPPVDASLLNANTLVLKMGFSSWHDQRKDYLLDRIIPDHGHLMHAFLLRLPEMDRFYHLHPDRTAQDTFSEKLPAVSRGDYQVFADIVREAGFADTMTARITLPEVAGQALNGDDSSASATPITNAEQKTTASFESGGGAAWMLSGQPIRTQAAMLLRFRILDQAGKPATDLEPYMGMAGHLVIVKKDLSVFAHVHPSGSVPMAAILLLQKNGANSGEAMSNMPGMAATALPSEVTFPYGFPQAGQYRLFVQVKRAGRIETAVFDTNVAP
jgi:hypothetical protein